MLEQLREREIHRAHQRELASDLHDTVAHQLGSIALWAERAARNGGASVEEIQHNGRMASFAMRDLRRIMEFLDVGATDEPAEPARALTAVVALGEQRLIKAGFSVKVILEGEIDSLPERVAIPLEKTLTEIVNNIERHADVRTPVAIVVEMTPDAVELLVTNGFSSNKPAAEGRGLTGVRERIELIGGNVEILTNDHHWTVHLAAPLRTEPA